MIDSENRNLYIKENYEFEDLSVVAYTTYENKVETTKMLAFIEKAEMNLYPTFEPEGTCVSGKKFIMKIGEATRNKARAHIKKKNKNRAYVDYYIFKSLGRDYLDVDTKDPEGVTGYYYVLTLDEVMKNLNSSI